MRNRRIIVPVKKSKEYRIVIDTSGGYAMAALILDGEPVEFMSVDKEHGSAVSNIYLGKVETVSKNGFAFVDCGFERSAFLNLNDNKNADKAREIRPGGIAAVQVLKDAIKDKGAYTTTRLTWSGRFFVIEPGEEAVSVSRKITDQKERDRLTSITEGLLAGFGITGKHVIVRTDAENAAPSFLESELKALVNSVLETENKISSADPLELPLTVYQPYSGICAMLAGELMASASYSVKEIALDDENWAKALAETYEPKGVTVKYISERPFARYNLEKAIESTKHRQVELSSGAQIIFDHTEACIVIDVNSGHYSGRKAMEDMALKINIEAAREIARQLRLRNLGGVILIDFIGMKEPANADILINELKAALSSDNALTTVEGMTRLGFVEMTRKRTRGSLWG